LAKLQDKCSSAVDRYAGILAGADIDRWLCYLTDTVCR